MMKNFFVVVALCFAQSVSSQENSSSPIQTQHQQTTFIHVNDLANFSQEEIAMLKGNYVVFDGELTKEKMQQLLLASEMNKSMDVDPAQSLKPEEQQFVKEWLSQHSDIKIVTRTEYNLSPENIRNEYVKSHCLILTGEIVTREDILNY